MRETTIIFMPEAGFLLGLQKMNQNLPVYEQNKIIMRAYISSPINVTCCKYDLKVAIFHALIQNWHKKTGTCLTTGENIWKIREIYIIR